MAGRESSTPPIYQEAFFDPDVLVEWDTVDTVRLFRKVSRRPKALSREGPPSRPPSSTSNETKIDGEVSDTATNDRVKARVPYEGFNYTVAVALTLCLPEYFYAYFQSEDSCTPPSLETLRFVMPYVCCVVPWWTRLVLYLALKDRMGYDSLLLSVQTHVGLSFMPKTNRRYSWTRRSAPHRRAFERMAMECLGEVPCVRSSKSKKRVVRE